MNTKKRILALLLGFTIIFNVTLSNFRNTYAVAVVDDAVGIGVVLMLLAACGISVSALSSQDSAQLAGDFINYLASSNLAEDQDLYAEIIDITNLYRGSGGGNQKPNRNKAFLKLTSFVLLSKKVKDFMSNRFNSDTGVVEYPFSVQTSVSTGVVDSATLYNAAVDMYQNFYGVSTVNRYFNDSNWGIPALLNNGSRPYITFVGGINYSTSDSPQYFGAIASPTKFLDIVERSNGRYKAGDGCRLIVWTPSDNDAHGEYSYGFDLSQISILAQYYYDPSSEPNISSGTGTENQDLPVSDVSPLKMALSDFISKLQSKFEVNDLTGEPEVEFDPNHILDPLPSGTPLSEVLPNITPDTVFDPNPSLEPNPYLNPDPETNPNLQPAADAQPISGPVTVTNTGDIAYSISQTYGKGNVDLNKFKIKKDLSTTFPFSLPWDIMRILNIFRADPQAPVFEFDFSGYYPFNQVPARYSNNLVFRLDLSDFDAIIKVEKFFITLSYAIFLITITRSKMIRG